MEEKLVSIETGGSLGEAPDPHGFPHGAQLGGAHAEGEDLSQVRQQRRILISLHTTGLGLGLG